jgi:hypothetical protein
MSATPSRATVGSKHTVFTAGPTRHEQPPQSSPSSSDTSLPREDHPALPLGIPSGHDHDALRADDTRETSSRLSDSGVELNTLKSLAPALSPAASMDPKASSNCNLTVSRSSTVVRRHGAAVNTQAVQDNYYPPLPSPGQPKVNGQPPSQPAPKIPKLTHAVSDYAWPTEGGRTLNELPEDPPPQKGIMAIICPCIR